eukprot:jgi/Ulvmu1/7870/UM004_0101.1
MQACQRKDKLAAKALSCEQAVANRDPQEHIVSDVSCQPSGACALQPHNTHSATMPAVRAEACNAGSDAQFLFKRASADLLESGIEATLHDIEQPCRKNTSTTPRTASQSLTGPRHSRSTETVA